MKDLAVGQVQWHTSEEGGGPDVGMLLKIDDDNSLWVGEISRDLWEKAGQDAADLGSDMGWWMIHYTKTEATVLGKCVSAYPEFAAEILDHLSAAIRSAR